MKGRTLRSMRHRAGISGTVLAEALGVSWNTVYRWERNEVAISGAMENLINMTLDRIIKQR